MANEKANFASGAAPDGQDIRRRNVPSHDTNGSITHPEKEIDDKKSQKVSAQDCVASALLMSDLQPKSRSPILATLDEYEFLIAPLIFTILAFFTRMYKIGLSDIVTWDEAQ